MSQKTFHWSCALILWVLCTSSVADAEKKSSRLREVGVWGSGVRTNHGGQTIEDSAADRIEVLGFAAGAFARVEFGRLGDVGFGIQPEIGYSPRGADVELDGVYLGNTRTSYLDVSLLGRIESPALGPVAFHAVAGPTLGVLLSASSGNMDGSSLGAREGTSKLDASLALGVGATVGVTSRFVLGLETRYVHGFVSIDNTGQVEIQNRAIFFSLGVAVRLGTDEVPSLGE